MRGHCRVPMHGRRTIEVQEISAEGRVTEHVTTPMVSAQRRCVTRGRCIPLAPQPGIGRPLREATWRAGLQAKINPASERTDSDFFHDWRGQLARQTTYESFNARGRGCCAATTKFVYSASGLLLKTIDAKAGVTQMTYDGMGRLQTTTDALNRVSRMAYDDSGQGGARHPLFDGRLSTTFYDQLGRLRKAAAETEAIGASGDFMSSNVTSRGYSGKAVRRATIECRAYNKMALLAASLLSSDCSKQNSALMVGLNATRTRVSRYQEAGLGAARHARRCAPSLGER